MCEVRLTSPRSTAPVASVDIECGPRARVTYLNFRNNAPLTNWLPVKIEENQV
jgi:hypothetical protein